VIEPLFAWITQNTGALTVIFSFIVAIATVVYAVLTRQLVKETRDMRKLQTEPKISVVIQPEENAFSLLDMTIENIGMGPAKDIRLAVNPDIKSITGQERSEMDLIKNGIPYLAPRQKIKFVFANNSCNLSELSTTPYHIVVDYKDCIGTPYHETIVIDLSVYAGMVERDRSPLCIIAKEMEKIHQDLERIGSSYR